MDEKIAGGPRRTHNNDRCPNRRRGAIAEHTAAKLSRSAGPRAECTCCTQSGRRSSCPGEASRTKSSRSISTIIITTTITIITAIIMA